MSNEVVVELNEAGYGKIIVNGQEMRYVKALRIEAAAGEINTVHLTLAPAKIIAKLGGVRVAAEHEAEPQDDTED